MATTVTPRASGRLKALVAILARTSGAEARAVGLTPYLALVIVASVIFGGNGMRPHDITSFARASVGFRVVLLAAWLLMSMPAARAILTARSTFYLRCMPLPAWIITPVLLGFMVLVELPWCWLWTAGEGPAGAGAVALAIAGHALLVSRPSRASEIAGALATIALIATGTTTARGTLSLWNVAGWPLAGFAVWRAWCAAPARGSSAARAVVRRDQPRLIALAAAHLATLLRRHRPVLLRWAWLAGTGAFCGVLAVRNNGLQGGPARTLWLACLVPGLLFGAAGMIGPLARLAAKASWMLLSCGVSASQRRLAFALALLPLGLALGAGTGALSALALARPSRLSQVSWSSVLEMVLLGMLAAGCAVTLAATTGLRSIEGRGRDAANLLVKMAVLGGLLMLATWRFDYLGLLVTTALAALPGVPLGTEHEDAVRSMRIAQHAE